MIYRHTQIGKLTLAILAAAMALIAALFLATPGEKPLAVVAAVLASLLVAMLLFGSLTVEVTPSQVTVRFGPGLIRKTFKTADIRGARIVRNPWYYGWGIRLTPRGWMFNVSGFQAVEIDLGDGRRFRIGTDEPERLLAAIQRATGLG